MHKQNSMKKLLCRVGVFTLAFCTLYLGCCYLIPGWRLKLAADPVTYFMATVRSMVPIKAGISLAGAWAISVILANKRRK